MSKEKQKSDVAAKSMKNCKAFINLTPAENIRLNINVKDQKPFFVKTAMKSHILFLKPSSYHIFSKLQELDYDIILVVRRKI